MVKLSFVNNPIQNKQSRPIGVLASIAAGFDQITARPQLIVPILLLDLFLWFGPHLSIAPLIPQDLALIGAAADGVAYAEEVAVNLEEVVRGLNVLGGLSVYPLGLPFNMVIGLASILPGVPSLMASRIPTETPIGAPVFVAIDDAFVAILAWTACVICGLYVGVFLHRSVARQVAPDSERASRWTAWRDSLALGLGAFIVGTLFILVCSLLITIVNVVFHGEVEVALGVLVLISILSLCSWIAIYLYFTVHGIVLHGYGLIRAMLESVNFVRVNLISAVSFLLLAFGITLVLTNFVWFLPQDESWLMLLAVFGHAFVGATLLAASYVFYQQRREWLAELMAESIDTIATGGDPGQPVA